MARKNRKDTPSSIKIQGYKAYGSGPEGGKASRRSGRSGRDVRPIALAAAGLIILLVLLNLFFNMNGLEIFVNDESIGIVKNSNITEEYIINTAVAQIESECGAKIQINEKITSKELHADKKKLLSEDAIITKLKNSVTYSVNVVSVYVNGAWTLSLGSESEVEKLFNSIIDEYIPEGSTVDREQSGFIENVTTAPELVPSEKVSTYDEAFAMLTGVSDSQKTYTVTDGDTLFGIAVKEGTTVNDILALNPDITVNTVLKIGQRLTVDSVAPFVSVKTVETVEYTEKEPKTVEYRKDDTKSKSYSRVIQQGKDGQRRVTAQIIRINGFEEETKVVSKTITEEPVTEIILVGTK